MPPTNPVLAGATLTAGLRADFWDVYRQEHQGVQARLADAMDMNVTSNKLTEIYAYFESAPYPRHWPRGKNIASKGFRSVQFSVTNLDWGRRVNWHVNDRADDQTRSLFAKVREVGANWATLSERVFFQILSGAADPELLPTIPLAPDGAALYATTAAGLNRFGVAQGNLLTGGGVVTGQQIRDDFFAVREQFRLFQNTEGEPLHPDSVVDGGIKIYYNAALEREFAEAFQQLRPIQVVQNAGATDNVGGAAVTNLVLDTGQRVQLISTQRITSNDWFCFLVGSRIKPIFRQTREAVFESVATWDNSDHTRDTQEEYIQWKSREGYGIMIPYATIQVNN